MFNRIATWAARAAIGYLSNHWASLALRAIEAAERALLGTKRGREKMELAVSIVRGMLPWWAGILFNAKTVEGFVQAVFDTAEGKLAVIAAHQGGAA